ncbi:MAG TPA: radical SAM protein [bacterium]|nr:radical SAM protein [bacterium]
MFQHIFGPVHSRRLGTSLGIDLVPLKTCNLNCIYCECGRTTHLTMERKEYVPFDEVCEELTRFFIANPTLDYLTFSGSGEPLLYSRAGELIEWIKERAPDIPLAILTNGTLFTDPAVRREVLRADLILPSLDAASPALYRKVDHPHPILQIEKIIAGLVELRREYGGRIWLEVFIVPGFTDQESELSALREAILRIAPDRVQLNSLDRPGTLPNLRAASRDELERIISFWQLPNVEIVKRPASG